ncbi:MAG: hypothetical protein EOO45_02825 [Flavobacterium sp.]|nr:MAG: hypothetical protein EOO45_02825 [Flavobacterium sp.]
MVRNIFFSGVKRELEKFLIKKNNFQLSGETYDLILFEPSDEYVPEPKYTLSLSSVRFNNAVQRDLIKELLEHLKQKLSIFDYNSISRIKVYDSMDPYVNNLKTLTAFPGEETLELNGIRIGGAQITGYLLKSTLLKKLMPGNRLIFELRDKLHNGNGSTVKIIRIEEDYDIVCYTLKAINQIENLIIEEDLANYVNGIDVGLEEELVNSYYIVRINLDSVENVYSVVQ